MEGSQGSDEQGRFPRRAHQVRQGRDQGADDQKAQAVHRQPRVHAREGQVGLIRRVFAVHVGQGHVHVLPCRAHGRAEEGGARQGAIRGGADAGAALGEADGARAGPSLTHSLPKLVANSGPGGAVVPRVRATALSYRKRRTQRARAVQPFLGLAQDALTGVIAAHGAVRLGARPRGQAERAVHRVAQEARRPERAGGEYAAQARARRCARRRACVRGCALGRDRRAAQEGQGQPGGRHGAGGGLCCVHRALHGRVPRAAGRVVDQAVSRVQDSGRHGVCDGALDGRSGTPAPCVCLFVDFFACDRAHQRCVVLWLRTRYGRVRSDHQFTRGQAAISAAVERSLRTHRVAARSATDVAA